MPNVSLDHYAQDIKALAPLVTDVAVGGLGGPRIQRANSNVILDVVVISGNVSVTLLLAEGGLYIKAFRNATNTFYFKPGEDDPPVPQGGKKLSFGCSYIGNNSMGIYENEHTKTTARSKQSLDQAVRDLSAYTAGVEDPLKVPLALLVMAVSESLRFTIVYDKMVQICKGAGDTFTFADVQKWVQNWKKMANGEYPPGTLAKHVFTRHH